VRRHAEKSKEVQECETTNSKDTLIEPFYPKPEEKNFCASMENAILLVNR